MMLWLRGLVFTALVPAVVAFFVPMTLYSGKQPQEGIWRAGWMFIVVGALIYLLCLLQFLAAGGTPAIFFARHLRFFIGEEPSGLVSGGLYRFSRNPMYVGVLLVVFGQALLFASRKVAIYGAGLWVFFHLIIILVEEPHLRATRGQSYEQYSRAVPRWLGLAAAGR